MALAVAGGAAVLALLLGLVVWSLADGEPATDVAVDEPTDPSFPVPPTDETPPSSAPGESVPPGSTDPDTPPVTSVPRPPDAELQAEIDALQRFVERQRFSTFTGPVTVLVADDTTFDERVKAAWEARRAHFDDVGKVWGALGLVDPEVDLTSALASTAAAGAVAFYDPAAGELLVRDRPPTPGLRYALVVELTRALDDQGFELHRPQLDEGTDEQWFTFDAITDGSANRVADLYEQSLDRTQSLELGSERAEWEAAVNRLGMPAAVTTLAMLPSELGAPFVDELVFSEESDLDLALTAPPTTTDELLDVDRWREGEGAVSVAPPPADGEVFDEGLFGRLLLVLTLSQALDPDLAYEVAEGWGGDWFVAWETEGEEEGGVCVRADLTGDAVRDTDDLEEALVEWAATSGAQVERPEREVVRFTICGGGGGGAASRL